MKNNKSGEIPYQVPNDFFDNNLISRTKTLPDDERGATLWNDGGGRHCGITKGTGRGFTLIELLVVVLIIGILAAVAVPQYQKAVEKSKAAQALALLRPLIDAVNAYYMANGAYPTSLGDLDVDAVPNWNGTEKPYRTASDYRTGPEWSVWLFNSDTYGAAVAVSRMSGAYKGGGFEYSFYRVHKGDIPEEKIVCIEYANSFTKADGAYCEKLFSGTLFQGTIASNMRNYILP